MMHLNFQFNLFNLKNNFSLKLLAVHVHNVSEMCEIMMWISVVGVEARRVVLKQYVIQN